MSANFRKISPRTGVEYCEALSPELARRLSSGTKATSSTHEGLSRILFVIKSLLDCNISRQFTSASSRTNMKHSKLSNNSATSTLKQLLVMAFVILTIGCGEKDSNGVNTQESDGVNAKKSNIKEVEIDTVITKTIGVNYNKLEEIDGIFHLKGSHLPYTGKSFALHKNGEKQEIRIYKDGKEEGLQKFWYDNGNKMSEVNVKRNEQHGLSTFWYKSGNKKSETNWRDGKPDGLMSSWHEKGQRMEKGQKKSEVNFKDGKPDGLTVSWHENGQNRTEINYKDGTVISSKYWNSKGEEVDSLAEAK